MDPAPTAILVTPLVEPLPQSAVAHDKDRLSANQATVRASGKGLLAGSGRLGLTARGLSVVMPGKCDATFKVCVVGSEKAGTTSFIRASCHGPLEQAPSPPPANHAPALSAEVKSTRRGPAVVGVQLWDIVSRKDGTANNKEFFGKSHGAIIVVDASKEVDVTSWAETIATYSTRPALPAVLVLTKSDVSGAAIDDAKVAAHCKKLGIEAFYKVSARTGEGIDVAVEALVDLMVEQRGAEWPFLSITVSDPTTHQDAAGEYTQYKISTVSWSLTDGRDLKRSCVQRRFKQVAALQGELATSITTHPELRGALPPLPSATATKVVGRMNPAFIEQRRKDCEEWLNALIKHPFFAVQQGLAAFLRDEYWVPVFV